jgi:hypothetical protein
VSNLLSHEIFETITGPDGSEWQAIDGFFGYSAAVEVGDVCELHDQTIIFTPFYSTFQGIYRKFSQSIPTNITPA